MALSKKQIYIAGGLVLFITSLFSLGYHHFDEHFQILEFAWMKLDQIEADRLPWEYHNQMRPSMQPAVAVVLYRGLAIMGMDNPFTLATLLRILSAIVSFYAVILSYAAFKDTIKSRIYQKWFLLLSFFTWFAVYHHVRFSSESWSGTFILIGISLFYKRLPPEKWRMLITGILCGMAFYFRFQVGFMIAGFFLWLAVIRKERFIHITMAALGLLMTIGLGLLIDRWFYGEWTVSFWNYLDQNLLLGKVSSFGTAPWWYYFTGAIIEGIPPISLAGILGFLIVLIFKPRNVLIWAAVPFLLVHLVIGHKEIRFLFPLIAFLPLFIARGMDITKERWNLDFHQSRILRAVVKITWGVNLLLMIVVMFRPADYHISLYRTIYENYQRPVVVNYKGPNPYHRILDINFYRRDNVVFNSIDSLNDIRYPDDTVHLLATKEPAWIDSTDIDRKTIYTTFPAWIRHFNFNNWIERTKFWHVYELNPR